MKTVPVLIFEELQDLEECKKTISLTFTVQQLCSTSLKSDYLMDWTQI